MDLRIALSRRRLSSWALGGCLLAGAGALQAQGAADPPPVSASAPASDPGNAALAATGRQRFTGMCARCHGLNLVSNGIGFDLRTFPKDDKARFVRSVTKGLRAMPSFENVVKPADLDAIWAYIGSVNGWPP